jgi:1,4-dihydroxy-2-naphthoyl-CoA hydrolase
MEYCWDYQVQLRDTDAAGVVYFANFLALCHSAYEAALANAEINFQMLVTGDILLPIVHASADFKQPLFCGDQLRICLTPRQLGDSKFDITYQIYLIDGRLAGTVSTLHVAIERATRQRTDLPPVIQNWLTQASCRSI